MANIIGGNGSLDYSQLSFNVVDATISSIAGMGIGYIQTTIARNGRGKKVHYYYDKEAGGSIINVLTRKAVGIAASNLSNVILEQYEKLLAKKKLKEKQEGARVIHRRQLIENEHGNERKLYGKMEVNKQTNPGKDYVMAYDSFGNVCTDALMLSIPVSSPIRYVKTVSRDGGSYKYMETDEEFSYGASGQSSASFMSDHLVWYDTTALVSLSSDKDLVLTKVQGRDYTRKELVSNGDLSFSISGQICSEIPDVYPSDEVKKFYQIMRYKGVIEVNNQFLDQFGVSKIVIKSFNMPSREGYKSTQEYTFEAVGIQPDSEISVKEDAITIIDDNISEANSEETSKWSQLIAKRIEALKDVSVDLVGQGLALATGYLDSELDFD